jgi:hypothetical protein
MDLTNDIINTKGLSKFQLEHGIICLVEALIGECIVD